MTLECLSDQEGQTDIADGIVAIGINQAHRLPGAQGGTSAEDGQHGRGRDEGWHHMIAAVAGGAMPVYPAVVRWQNLAEGVEQVLLSSRPCLDDRYPGGGVGCEHVKEPIVLSADEMGDFQGQVDDSGLAAGANGDDLTAHQTSVPPTPDDLGLWLTRRMERTRPLTIVHTGTMRGKTTAAFGLALRAWAAGLPVGVFQFVKSGAWRTGEETALKALGRVNADTGEGAPVTWHTLGDGRSGGRATGEEAERAAKAVDGWHLVQRDLADERYGCYILDEFTYPITWGWIDGTEVVTTLRDRPGRQHVIITGRNADSRLIELADLVTEMVKIKHPHDHGQRAQRGIEW